MNVYDQAHGLAQAIKESDEFKQYQEQKEILDANENLAKIVEDFQQKQLELQAKSIAGEELGEDFQSQVQELYGIIMQDPLAAQYMQTEMRFSIMMNDVYKILGEVMGIGKNL
ncbi:YlbF family regulator [Eubacteriales bacterium KG127]